MHKAKKHMDMKKDKKHPMLHGHLDGKHSMKGVKIKKLDHKMKHKAK